MINGGGLFLEGNWTNTGVITAVGVTVHLGGTATNIGSFEIDGSGLYIEGSFTTSQVESLQGTPVLVSIQDGGEIINTGDVLTMRSNLGYWRLERGRIAGGIITGGAGERFSNDPRVWRCLH